MRGSLFITLTSFLSRLGEGEDEGAFELGNPHLSPLPVGEEGIGLDQDAGVAGRSA